MGDGGEKNGKWTKKDKGMYATQKYKYVDSW